ncbi:MULTISPECIES: glycosyltransferase family A protein [unclassified Novosphingobium]|uniref:glycosyltransferase family 2 protein n=1 Tax=unclassified Novosphingobium TaxID=2644732 RepID=UPI0025FFF855|nr:MULTISPECIES: glycosyltransferase family A protein [unclassified Novosphingobium]HQV02220.1 glycosyltransferase family A protein [Novosphingobium sp.]
MSEVALPPVIPAAPRVAVIVPAYGVAHLVGEALDSLLAQSMPDWECVVIDDGAPDDVAGAVAPYLHDPRIRFLATDNHGVSGARNTAIAATSAPYIALLDGDDRFRPDYLARTTARLDADPSLCLVTVNAHIFGAVPRERLCFEGKQGAGDGLHGTLAEVLDRSFGVYIGTTFRRSEFERTKGFDTTFTHCEDFDMWVQLMQLGGLAGYIDEVLGEYRVRVDSASASREKMLRGNLRVYDKAIATLPSDAPELALARRLAHDTQQAIDFEHAMDRVIDGDTAGGLAALRAVKEQVTGPVWTLSFALWTLFPSLARPMLAWRRRKHSRGGSESGLKAVLQSAVS